MNLRIPLAAILLGIVLLHADSTRLLASELVVYEGEFTFNIPSSPPREPPPFVHVVTKDGHIQQITLRDRHSDADRIDKFYFKGTTLIRYKSISAASGKITATHDFSRETTVSRSERERIFGWSSLLYSHFHMKGGYRKLESRIENR